MRTIKLKYVILFLLLAGAVFFSLLAGPAGGKIHFSYSSDPIFKLRLLRTLLGVLVGAALSSAGVVYQALLRNVLAEPYILGVSSGAGLGAALAISAGVATSGSVSIFAFLGAIVAVLLVYNLARSDGLINPHTLILSGVIVGAMLSAMLMFIVSTSSREGLHNVIWWMLGSLEILNLKLLKNTAVLVIVLSFIALLLSRQLDIISLGEEHAQHLGLSVERSKMLFLVIASLLAASAVSAAGIIPFVGLMVPHICRSLFGAMHKRLLIVSMVAGAAFMLIADGLSRILLAPRQLPVGVLTAFSGGPFFLFLLRKGRGGGWSLR